MKNIFGNIHHIKRNLADKYLIAPTSVLSKRTNEWQKLKHKWLKLGVQSELGRLDHRAKLKGNDIKDYDYFKRTGYKSVGMDKMASIFDPVLCEIMYKWFCIENGNVLDPFAGGSVRGVVANHLGFNYTGIELRQEQVDSNREQAKRILTNNNQPTWHIGDSDIILDSMIKKYDMLFSCPPYMNLEIYSKLPTDLSNMPDNEFISKYNSIIQKSCKLLKNQSYAIFVVGDLRDKEGYLKDFPGITKKAFELAGMKLYNEIILVDHVGTKALTLERGFKNKKVAKVHQTIYVFKK